METNHVITLCLACTKITDLKRKTDVEHKPHCFSKQFRYSESLRPVREWEPLILVRTTFYSLPKA